MSKSWLKMLGTSDEPCPETWTDNHVHFRKDKPSRIQWGASYIELQPEEYEQAAALLHAVASPGGHAEELPVVST